MHKICYERWLSHKMEDADLTKELLLIKDEPNGIKERFAIDLSFGTAGMRGVIGAGTNRMNIYTVRRASQGFANFLKKGNSSPIVAIAYDSRNKSQLFATEAARVLAANGVRVFIFPALQPVPLLSFALRQLLCSAGIVITASHNPAKYNGYKVYGADGCQMNTENAGLVLKEIERLDIFDDAKTMAFDDGLQSGIISYIGNDVLTDYNSSVLAQSIYPSALKNTGLKVVYSPLNGSGNLPVRRVLKSCGLLNVAIVPQQELPDGNFPTCPYPNPEIRQALELGLQLAENTGADLMLATDPDADRVGIAVRASDGTYHLLSGNEVGVLLLNYICDGRKQAGTLPKNAVVVKSIVSTPMANVVAAHHGVHCQDVLTGFKYIGEYILNLEKNGEENRFIFGFEESYGYLAGSYVRDKDAVVASMLICEAAAHYKELGQSLYSVMQNLYKKFGHYLNQVESFDFEGLSGMDKMNDIMAKLRKNPPKEIGGLAVVEIADYSTGKRNFLKTATQQSLGLPKANVLAFTLLGGSLVTVRPSGTEPKIKVYFSITEKTQSAAQALRQILGEAVKPLLG